MLDRFCISFLIAVLALVSAAPVPVLVEFASAQTKTAQDRGIDSKVQPRVDTKVRRAQIRASGANPAERESACSKPAAAGTTELQITSGGVNRRALRVVPQSYNGTRRIPLVLLFHWSGGSPEGILEASKFDRTGGTNGFVVVAPRAYLFGSQWNIPGVPLPSGAVPPGSPSDIVFVRDLLDAVLNQLCIDSSRIYAAGFSGGARFSSTLGCEMGDRLSAIAPVGGLRFPEPCSATRPVPVISFHGTLDTTNTFDGKNGPSYWTYGVEDAAERWANHNGCGANPSTTTIMSNLSRETWSKCRDDSQVNLYVIKDAGHWWPEPAYGANDRIWAFFRDHPLN
jgi:polyhydroxybutyrate depolymerase